MRETVINERNRTVLKAFYAEMNKTAKKLGLGKSTHFSVSHGMHHDYNYSTAIDIATISCYAMR